MFQGVWYQEKYGSRLTAAWGQTCDQWVNLQNCDVAWNYLSGHQSPSQVLTGESEASEVSW